MNTNDEATRAGRLIQWGLRPRARPVQEEEYRELLVRYQANADFRSLVQAFARGLGMQVLEAADHGLVLAPAEGSIFVFPASEFRPGTYGADDRFLDGLVQIAIAAAIFPRARDLEDPATVARPPVTVDEVEQLLRSVCDAIAAEQRDRVDLPAHANDSLIEAWRVYRNRLASRDTGDERKARRATRRIIEVGLERLREAGCFTRDGDGDAATWQPTWRYQVLMREFAAEAAFTRVQRMLEAIADTGAT